MTPLLFTLAVVGISLLAGFLGSLLGLGGGLIVIPALTLVLHVDIRLAIGASIVSVIATSSGAAAAYVRGAHDHRTASPPLQRQAPAQCARLRNAERVRTSTPGYGSCRRMESR